MTKSYETFKGKRKRENYTKLTKKENIRARSYFKLQQLDKKYSLVEDKMHIIDLGCAPGGWLQYIDSKIETGKVIGIDLLEVQKHNEFSSNIQIIQDDFDNIEEYTTEEFDLVLSDMAPEFSGNYKVDRGRTHKLNLKVLDFCKNHLKKDANCLFKTFEGEDLPMVREVAKKIFYQIKEYKPMSSQKKSAETFIVCIKKK